jgi:hypothetical protein
MNTAGSFPAIEPGAQVGLERVALAAEGVAPHGQVDGIQALLVGAAV